MKYESDILEMIHENAIANYKIGILSEAEMRKYDELCLPEEVLQNNTAQGTTAHEENKIEEPAFA
jgi:putative transcriptional regulator